jgi:hypothetical protein
MKSSKRLTLLALMGSIIFSKSVQAAQPVAKGERGQKAGAKWNTVGLRQANSMGGGEAAISKADGIHFNTEGQIKVEKITASAMAAFYQTTR